jgi:uncharacterized protein YqkB
MVLHLSHDSVSVDVENLPISYSRITRIFWSSNLKVDICAYYKLLSDGSYSSSGSCVILYCDYK